MTSTSHVAHVSADRIRPTATRDAPLLIKWPALGISISCSRLNIFEKECSHKSEFGRFSLKEREISERFRHQASKNVENVKRVVSGSLIRQMIQSNGELFFLELSNSLKCRKWQIKRHFPKIFIFKWYSNRRVKKCVFPPNSVSFPLDTPNLDIAV